MNHPAIELICNKNNFTGPSTCRWEELLTGQVSLLNNWIIGKQYWIKIFDGKPNPKQNLNKLFS